MARSALIAMMLSFAATATWAQTPTSGQGVEASPSHRRLDVDLPIQDIAANPAGRAILKRDIPGLLTHPLYDSFKSMSLKDVEPLSEGKITDDLISKVRADLGSVPAGE